MIHIHAPAKINWCLNILGKRPDGYHEMDMLMQHISLCDELYIEEADALSLCGQTEDTRRQETSDPLSSGIVQFDESNIVLKAARLLQSTCHIPSGASIRLLKRIPSGAGLGGGSADAAAALTGLNELWHLELSRADLKQLGLRLGADVPYMLTDEAARVTGIGEIIKPLIFPKKYWLLLLQPCGGLSTGEIFSAFDKAHEDTISKPDVGIAETLLSRGLLSEAVPFLQNVFQPICAEARPAIALCIEALKKTGALHAAMTGSGSVVYGAFAKREEMERAHIEMERISNQMGFGTVYTAETLSPDIQ